MTETPSDVRVAKENAALRDRVADAQKELGEVRSSHATLLRGIKSFLGLSNWPETEGGFVNGVVQLLHKYRRELTRSAR